MKIVSIEKDEQGYHNDPVFNNLKTVLTSWDYIGNLESIEREVDSLINVVAATLTILFKKNLINFNELKEIIDEAVASFQFESEKYNEVYIENSKNKSNE